MGRIKLFQNDEALTKATYLFWEKGYEKTSLAELLREMNILNGSFYNSYGSKKNLFIMSLDYYLKTHALTVANRFKAKKTFKEGISDLFNNSLKNKNLDHPKGCFLINCLASPALIQDDELGKIIKEKLGEFYCFIEKQFVLAQRIGEISIDLDPTVTTHLILTYLHGRMQMTEVFPHDKKSKKQIDHLLNSLGV